MNELILAVDPGTIQSAWVVYDASSHRVVACGLGQNADVLYKFRGAAYEHRVAIEMVACYGMAVGREVFETCVWVGRFIEAFGGGEFVYRRDVKLELCNSTKAKDPNVRQAILDRFPATGGGAVPQVGTKKQPGPLFGVKSDMWAALGVALTFAAKLPDVRALLGEGA